MSGTINARLIEKTLLSSEVCRFTFEALGARFTDLEPGAHIDVHLALDLVRNYSLCGWDEAGGWLSIAVKREPNGRGGSKAMHDLQVGAAICIGGPRNNFPLVTSSEPIVLVAGGIGVTPLYAMATTLQKADRSFDFHYLVRSQSVAAFGDDLAGLKLGGRYHLFCSDNEGILDFELLIARYAANTHYYVCGPPLMLEAFLKAQKRLGRGTVYFERFGIPEISAESRGYDRAFEIILNSSGEVIQIPADKTILQVLRDANHEVEYGCAEGVCGTCITDVLGGEIDHRDHVLTEDERLDGDCMCICVSRAKSGRLTLGL